MASKKIYIFALAAHGEGISGSDRIFIEFARNWSKEAIRIFVSDDGYQMCLRQGLQGSHIRFQVSGISNYLVRIIEGLKIGLTIKLDNSQETLVYSASEFWMDSLPAFMLKLRYPKIRWIAAWYQTAPNPLKGFAEGDANGRYRAYAFIYFLMQFPIKLLIKKCADFVLVNNENERKTFLGHVKKGRAVVVHGAVNLEEINKWRLKNKALPKVYDAVFQGRFHPQKGVMELIKIWKMVTDQKADAKLVLVGNGPLRRDVEKKIYELGLKNNVILRGYLFDGEEKYRIFSQSKVVVHPSFYDSGGMASLEAMVFGLPCVGFDLSAYKYYYPKGMLKVKIGGLEGFADQVVQLLRNKGLYRQIQKEIEHLVSGNLSWKFRSRQILDQVLE